MARRSVWLVTGAVAGAASSLYAERRLRRTLEAASARLQPEALAGEVGRTARRAARSTGGRVRDALSTGRATMHRRESELWADLAASGAATAPDGAAVVDPSGDGGGGGAAPPVRDEPVTRPPADRTPRDRSRRRSRRSPSHLGK